jgi:hypothetical protein
VRWAIFIVCWAALVSNGCAIKKRPNIPWATAIQVKPVAQASTVATTNPDEDALPELRFELPPFPGRLAPARTSPPRPHNGAAAGTGAGSEFEKAPLIAPQITAQESAVAPQQTIQSLSIAEKNLELARGKNLSAAQSDLVSKIKSYIKDAREAAKIADWSQARSLAKKAQVLSEELAGSL